MIDRDRAERRDRLFEFARNAICRDAERFASAGSEIGKVFSDELAISETPTGFSQPSGRCTWTPEQLLFARLDLVLQAVLTPGSARAVLFDFLGNDSREEREHRARMFVLAVLLAGDPEIDSRMNTQLCELAALPWRSRDWRMCRSLLAWNRGPHDDGDEPPASVLDRLEAALRLVGIPASQPRREETVWLKPSEVAGLLGKERDTVTRAARLGLIVGKQDGNRRWLIDAESAAQAWESDAGALRERIANERRDGTNSMTDKNPE